MAWVAVALAGAELIIKVVGAKITDSISLAELQDALSDAVDKIELNTKRIILEENIRAIRADIESVSRLLTEYRNAPKGVDRLDHATASVTSLVSNCKTLSLFNPLGPGLAGHPYFLIAVNLNIAVLQERQKVYGVGEKQNIINLLVDSVAHARKMEMGWQPWNEARFGDLYIVWMNDFKVGFTYKLDNKEQPVAETCKFYDLPDSMEKLIQNAQKKRKDHILLEYEKLKNEFVVPSQDVVSIWHRYSMMLKMPQFNRVILDEMVAVKSYRDIFGSVGQMPVRPRRLKKVP
jgi:hypothetical protein